MINAEFTFPLGVFHTVEAVLGKILTKVLLSYYLLGC